VTARVQQKLAHNQQRARRNTQHPYLLRGHVSCGQCQLTATARATPQGHQYYVCRGRTDRRRSSQGQCCTSRYIPAGQLDEVVWADLCAVLTDPQQLAAALERALTDQSLPADFWLTHGECGDHLRRLIGFCREGDYRIF